MAEFSFMNLEGMSIEDQDKLNSILFGENENKLPLPPDTSESSAEEESSPMSSSPVPEIKNHVFNVHAQEFIPMNLRKIPETLPSTSALLSSEPRKITVLQNPNSKKSRNNGSGDAVLKKEPSVPFVDVDDQQNGPKALVNGDINSNSLKQKSSLKAAHEHDRTYDIDVHNKIANIPHTSNKFPLKNVQFNLDDNLDYVNDDFEDKLTFGVINETEDWQWSDDPELDSEWGCIEPDSVWISSGKLNESINKPQSMFDCVSAPAATIIDNEPSTRVSPDNLPVSNQVLNGEPPPKNEHISNISAESKRVNKILSPSPPKEQIRAAISPEANPDSSEKLASMERVKNHTHSNTDNAKPNEVISGNKRQVEAQASTTVSTVKSATPTSTSHATAASVQTLTSNTALFTTPTPKLTPTPPAPRSWAALVSHNLPAQAAQAIVIQETTSTPQPGPTTYSNSTKIDAHVDKPESSVVHDSSDYTRRLREYLTTAHLIHRPPSLYPRGLINRANWCYVNATLQALLACPPFYNMFKNFPRGGTTNSPVLNSIQQFFAEFSFFKPPSRKKFDRQAQVTISTGQPFEPDYVYKMLTELKNTDSFLAGRQEDAEEFLTCVLNHLHEELLSITNPEKEETDKAAESLENGPKESTPALDTDEPDGVGDDSVWEQVGRKKKAMITRASEMPRSLVSDIFCGQIRSILRQSGSRESATLEPFFSLPLDIQQDKIRSVKDALDGLVSRESIQGYTCSRTKEEVEATKCSMLEVLPPVLILQMKCFIYDKNGGCQKLCKELDYPVDLEISKELISPTTRYKDNQRWYKLFAVVYHHGKTLAGGHYTTDVYHNGINRWIHIDDHNITVVHLMKVLKFFAPRMPYLLYYRRYDSIGEAMMASPAMNNNMGNNNNSGNNMVN